MDVVDALDVASGTWTWLPLSGPRTRASVAVVGNRLLVAGGYTSTERGASPSALVEVLDLGSADVPPSR